MASAVVICNHGSSTLLCFGSGLRPSGQRNTLVQQRSFPAIRRTLRSYRVHAEINRNQRSVKDWENVNLYGGPPQVSSEPEVRSDGLIVEQLVTLETNIDDMSSELLAYAMEQLLRAGALDVWSLPAVMKKGRPGHILHVLCKREQADPLLRIILRETTSMGVRVSGCERVSLKRVMEQSYTPWGWVPVKAAYMEGSLVSMHAEYEDCAKLARQHNVPLKVVYDTAHKNFLDSERSEPKQAAARK